MRILIIKTSSMGDIIHTLPALTDAIAAIPNIRFDWVVEDAFSIIPSWHPAVDRIIPVSLRRWRKGIFTKDTRAEWKEVRRHLSERTYDAVIDAQGLLKSAFLSRYTYGVRMGLDFQSARERLASLFYQRRLKVPLHQHAIHRMRSLFSQALQYSLPESPANYGIHLLRQMEPQEEPYVVFLHATTWETKLWPEAFWMELIGEVAKIGWKVKVSGGNPLEVARAKRFERSHEAVQALPYLSIQEMAELLQQAKGVISVDTGFGHLAAALNVPTLSLYGSTDPALTGAIGPHSYHLKAHFACAPCLKRTCIFQKNEPTFPPCYESLSPKLVWERFKQILNL